MILFKLKLAIRNLLKDKVNSTLIIGGFAIGFTAFILIGLFYVSEHRVNKVFTNSENIYRIYDAKQETVNLDYDLFPALLEQYPEIVNACPMEYAGGFPLVIKDSELDANFRVNQMMATTENFFDIFEIEIVESISDKAFAFDKSMVITQSVAKQMYGSVSPLGRTLTSDWFEGTITAVIKDIPRAATFDAELIINSGSEDFRMSQSCNDGRCWFTTPHFVVFNNSVNPVQFAEKVNLTIKDVSVNVDSLAFQNIEDIYLTTMQVKDSQKRGNSKVLSIFLVIGILILLLSSINYINFTVSKQFSKQKEFGIKKTNGANLANLFTGSLVEVSLGILLSVGLALLITLAVLPYTEIIFGKRILFFDANTRASLLVFFGIVVFVILLNSLAPVYVLTKFNITDFLAGSSKRTGKQIGRQAMLTFQLVASIVLIAAVLTIFKQLQYVKHYDLGFNEEHLVRFELPYFYETPSTLKEEIGKLPFVAGSTLSDGHPGHVKLRMGSGDSENNFTVHCITISDDYLETMGMNLLEGREFHLGDEGRTCLFNEEAIKRYGWDNIKDKTYKQGGKGGYKVLGVVENFNTTSLHSAVVPLALLYRPEEKFGALSVRLTPGNISQQLNDIEKVWTGILPNEPMYFTFYDQQFQALYEKEVRLAKSVSFFSLIAIVLTCMGILGQILLISFTRTKEISIRKVNGAKVSEILSMLNKDFIKWVAIAFVIACPIAYYAMNKWLENFAYKTTLSWWIFALAGVLALGIALLTVSWQSWRAATRNPVEVLRYE
ncbi:ABC transporter permease [uncultured Draconibacterium sp.]|uniref:ABC transporter permease n=1 Tax=uncultured Draconibacterium sp. TaxID=1573823 RepID=UPI0025D0F214|nr:ABC transporter permease [uncultured Draconibacterium sp.]